MPSMAFGQGTADAEIRHHDEPRATASKAWWAASGAEESALTQIRMLNEALLAGHSATLVLDAWCAHNGMAQAGAVRVEKISAGRLARIPTGVHKALAVERGGDILHRRVRLMCGAHILSEADNWFVPARVTPAMRDTLATTDTSFGRVVAPLNFIRRPLSLRMIATSATIRAAAAQLTGFDLFAHDAVLMLPDGRPLAYVRETYKSGALSFDKAPDTLSR